MKFRKLPEVARLRERLDYNLETGIFRWKQGALKGRVAGTEKASATGGIYIDIRFDGGDFRAHRLAFKYVSGRNPRFQIDHINLATTDNRFSNLREATNAENNRNVGVRVTNKSGFKGVCWYAKNRRWVAQIRIDGRQRHLGYFDSPETAHTVYARAAATHFGAFARSA